MYFVKGEEVIDSVEFFDNKIIKIDIHSEKFNDKHSMYIDKDYLKTFVGSNDISFIKENCVIKRVLR